MSSHVPPSAANHDDQLADDVESLINELGVDPIAAVRAAWQLATHGRIVSGASTLSMQAARLLDPGLQPAAKRSLLTKAVQSARALQLEWRYSKREILAIYLTLAPMGGNLEGVRSASFVLPHGVPFSTARADDLKVRDGVAHTGI